MLLKELIEKENSIYKWSVYDYKNNLIAMTSRDALIKLCQEKKEFKKTVDRVAEKDPEYQYINVHLKKTVGD